MQKSMKLNVYSWSLSGCLTTITLYLRPNINWDTGKLETIPPSRDNVNGSLFEMLKRTFIFLWSET